MMCRADATGSLKRCGPPAGTLSSNGSSQSGCGFGPPAFFLLVVHCSPRSSRRGIWAPHGGAARGQDTPGLAPRLRECLWRFACLRAQHPALQKQFARMSQARHWFSHSQGGGGARVRTLQGSRPDCGDVSGGLPVCVPNILCLQSRSGGCLERGAGFSTLGGAARPGVRALQDSCPDCGDVSGGLPVGVPNIFCFQSRL